MKITVAICTWNRAPSLRDTLSSLARMQVPLDIQWEVTVVNNNCTDETDVVIDAFRHALPVRRLFEPKPGLSNARNRAVAAFEGDYIVWTDDDVYADPAWLASYASAFRRHPQSAVFGGRISAHFDAEPPRWLADGIRHVPDAYGVRDLGPVEAPLDLRSNQFPFGANFAVRRAEQIDHPYDASIGRSPTRAFLGGEEIGVMCAILSAGGTGWWLPDARIAHRIRADQLRLDYVRKFYVGIGRWMGLADGKTEFASVRGYPAWMIRELLVRQARYWKLCATAPRAETLSELKKLCIVRGRLAAAAERRSAGA